MNGAKRNWLHRFRAAAGQAPAPTPATGGAERPAWETGWPGHTDPAVVSDALLHVRLAEAVAWCEALANPDDIRSETLRP